MRAMISPDVHVSTVLEMLVTKRSSWSTAPSDLSATDQSAAGDWFGTWYRI